MIGQNSKFIPVEVPGALPGQTRFLSWQEIEEINDWYRKCNYESGFNSNKIE